jgi:hypothetical protein
MAAISGVLTGTIHGKTIELDEPSGLPDGQHVQVTVRSVVPKLSDEERRELLRRAAGSWSDDPEGLDQYLEWNRQQRKTDRPEISE